jgi:tetraacyldisaccharide 4'-kinase
MNMRLLLLPFSILYDLITRIRNHLYDIGHKKSFRFETMVVGVGNLNVGGSGKTPMIEYLIKLLVPHHKVATLSRGYGRRTRGLRFATEGDTAATLGDEPFQFFRKFGHDVQVTVGEDRAFAIPNILNDSPLTDVILMDDAFQHRAVDPQLSILLTEYRHPFYNDWVLPAGNLREARAGARRSDVIVITKCPDDTTLEMRVAMEKSVQPYAPGKPVFFTALQYGSPITFGAEQPRSSEIVLVSGIANSHALEEYMASRFTLLRHFCYRDHHRYDLADLQAIHEFCRQLKKPVDIVTTEKDMVKLIDPQFKEAIDSMPWFYLPVQISFLKDGSDFDRVVLHAIEKEKQNS